MPRHNQKPRRKVVKAALLRRAQCEVCNARQRAHPSDGRLLPIKHARWCRLRDR